MIVVETLLLAKLIWALPKKPEAARQNKLPIRKLSRSRNDSNSSIIVLLRYLETERTKTAQSGLPVEAGLARIVLVQIATANLI